MINHRLLDLNKSAREFYSESLETFQKISKPVLDIGLQDFSYWQIHGNGSYLGFSNDQDFMDNYFAEIETQGEVFTDKLEHLAGGRIAYVMEGGSFQYDKGKNKVLQLLWDHNKWNTLFVHRQCGDDYVECYNFNLGREFRGASDFFLTNLNLFESYIKYFDVVARDLVDPRDKRKRGYFEQKFNLSNQPQDGAFSKRIEEFLVQISLEKLSLVRDGEEIQLTPRERECLFYLAQHKSAKEIARILTLSPRTVETYIQSMKSKAGCSSKSSLLSMFDGPELIFPHGGATQPA